MSKTILACAMLLFASSATAYVGPGAGISVLGSVLGILATIVLALVAVVTWPIRKMMKRRKLAKAATETSEVEDQA